MVPSSPTQLFAPFQVRGPPVHTWSRLRRRLFKSFAYLVLCAMAGCERSPIGVILSVGRVRGTLPLVVCFCIQLVT